LIVVKLTGIPCLPSWIQAKLKRSNSELNEIKIKFKNNKYEQTQSILICQSENSMAQHLRGNPSISESNSSIIYKTSNTKMSENKSFSRKKFNCSPLYKRSFTIKSQLRGQSLYNNDQINASPSPRSVSLKINNESSPLSFNGLSRNLSNSYISLMTTTNFSKRMKVYSRTTITLLTISTAYLAL
jgi:hypothetical protein